MTYHPPSPIEGKKAQVIKAIQQTFAYKITEEQHLNYQERLHEPKLYNL